MKKITLILLMISICLFTSCKKDEPIIPKPKAEFQVLVGNDGKVLFTNQSIESQSYIWDFGDGNTSTTSTSELHVFPRNKVFQVSLTATGKGGKDVIIKSVTINNLRGSVVIYKTFSTRNRNIDVYVDGTYYGQINGSYYYSASPTCGNQYSVTSGGLTEGNHRIVAKETGLFPYSWDYYLSVTGGLCSASGLSL